MSELQHSQLSDGTDPRIAYVTGTDAQRMLNAAILVASFNHHMPDEILHLCDFGMSDNESRFWSSVGRFLPKPAHLPKLLHPWKYKAGMCEFLEISSYDAVVWLDADMLLLAPIHEQVKNIVRAMKTRQVSVAVTEDGSNATVQQALANFSTAGKDTSSFAQLIGRYGKDVSDKYLNTGFLIISDFQFAHAWFQETMNQDDWVLFEQNTFNALVDRNKNHLFKLDACVWNVHGDWLGDVDVVDQTRTANILHTTSAEQRHHIENEIQYPIGQKVLPGWFKLFVRDDLRDIQQKHLLKFLQDNFGALEACNMLVEA